MNLNAKTAALLEGLEEAPGIDWYSLQEAHHPEGLMRVTDAVRRWAGVVGTTGSIRPGVELLAVLLGYGREGCLRIFEGYVRETARTDTEAAAALQALATLSRRAQTMRLISWNLDGVTVDAARGTKILVAFDPALDGRLRAAAAARSESLSDFIREAVRDRLFKLEKPLRRAGAELAAAAT